MKQLWPGTWDRVRSSDTSWHYTQSAIIYLPIPHPWNTLAVPPWQWWAGSSCRMCAGHRGMPSALVSWMRVRGMMEVRTDKEGGLAWEPLHFAAKGLTDILLHCGTSPFHSVQELYPWKTVSAAWLACQWGVQGNVPLLHPHRDPQDQGGAAGSSVHVCEMPNSRPQQQCFLPWWMVSVIITTNGQGQVLLDPMHPRQH